MSPIIDITWDGDLGEPPPRHCRFCGLEWCASPSGAMATMGCPGGCEARWDVCPKCGDEYEYAYGCGCTVFAIRPVPPG